MSKFEIVEHALENSQIGSFPQFFTFQENQFILYKHVFSPAFFKGSSVYIEHLPIKENQTMLDMGCGCGVIGITAFKKYNLKYVVCADINGYAVRNTKRNIKLHNLENYITAVQSDVFSNIDNRKKFDLIFWNAPYFDGEKKSGSVLYKSMYDKNYKSIKKFILDGQSYLNSGGKIMLGFSSTNFPLGNARSLVNEIGYDLQIYFQGMDGKGNMQEILDIVKTR